MIAVTEIFGSAALLAFALCGVARPALRRLGIIDKPNARSSHTVPTVRGLGVGIVAAVLAGWVIAGLGGEPAVLVMIPAGLILAVVSFIDDMRPLSSKIRFCCHALAAVAILVALVAGWPDRPSPAMLAAMLPVGFLFIAGYTNAFNFMDGINGIAGFQGLLTGLGAVAVLLAAGVPVTSPVVAAFAVLAGACGGFLPHNFPRARGFMGDVASATLGYWLSACTLWAVFAHGWALLLPLCLLHTNFILDTGITLVRRALRGEKLSQAHREHFYQRLVRSGLSHAKVTGSEAILQVVVLLIALRVVVAGGVIAALVGVTATVCLWGVFFLRAESFFRAASRKADS